MSKRHKWVPWVHRQFDQEGIQEAPGRAGQPADVPSFSPPVMNVAEAYRAAEEFAEIVARSLEKGGLR